MVRFQRLAVLVALAALLFGCTGVAEHIRQHDFRTYRRSAAREKAVPSPIADVFDMQGWTSDFDGATAFARVNGQKTIVFFYASGASSEKAKQTVESAVRRVSNVQKVALDFSKKKGIAERLGVVKAPAIVVLDPSGRVMAREQGQLTRADVQAALGL